ncbi:hypothetical protein [Corynebacterium alimapuense]|uniref:Uncharacterized protein n=1 Tax=Corynebacterium alimapuense TaxID=1576874 RepID=A0A3M8K679_9CORY|nr:hypothetical protein [Corynebacterium alimapuense]RNE48721.1 hypothetical protein C5L39_05245 [Corynebacterium alimapuense]
MSSDAFGAVADLLQGVVNPILSAFDTGLWELSTTTVPNMWGAVVDFGQTSSAFLDGLSS